MMAEISLEVSQECMDRCEAMVERTDFDSVESYLVFMIEEAVSSSDLSIEEVQEVDEEVSDQLESLGYL